MNSRTQTTLTELARLGFAELGEASERLADVDPALVPLFAHAADPDQALLLLGRLRESSPAQLNALLRDDAAAARLVRILGASSGLGEFFVRRPEELSALATELAHPLSPEQYRADLLEAVDGLVGDAGAVALRVRYRRHLARLAAWDLGHVDPLAAMSVAAAALSDLAGAALDAALDVARRDSRFPAADVAATRLSIIGMGKAGARELN